MTKILAWHFTSDRLRDGRPIPAPGVTLRHKGPIELCASGLHASRHPFDALQYAPGPNLHRVECSVDVQEESDKLVARERTIVASSDITGLLDHFARQRALSVAHLWKPPEVVLDFLRTGDSSLREAARAAAWDAARAAARDAAWDAARAAARSSFEQLVQEHFAALGAP